jgi:hypothetical protein
VALWCAPGVLCNRDHAAGCMLANVMWHLASDLFRQRTLMWSCVRPHQHSRRDQQQAASLPV